MNNFSKEPNKMDYFSATSGIWYYSARDRDLKFENWAILCGDIL